MLTKNEKASFVFSTNIEISEYDMVLFKKIASTLGCIELMRVLRMAYPKMNMRDANNLAKEISHN